MAQLTPASTTSAPLLEWGVAARTLAGERESGDLYLVAPLWGGVLVAVVDALGHGTEAAAAARLALRTLQAHAESDLSALARRCHEALLRTRGVAMNLASFGQGTMSWLAIGNVHGMLLRADAGATPSREAIVLRSGVVGYQLPPLRTSALPVRPDDTLVFATDGIRSGFVEALRAGGPPQQLADGILAGYARDSDDALVLVVRYLGDGA